MKTVKINIEHVLTEACEGAKICKSEGLPGKLYVELTEEQVRDAMKQLKEPQEKKWKDFGEVKGYYIYYDYIKDYEGSSSNLSNRDVWPTKELAESALALSQLLQWKQKDYPEKGNWRVWNDRMSNQIICDYLLSFDGPLRFVSEEDGEQFMKEHKTLLEIAKPLI